MNAAISHTYYHPICHTIGGRRLFFFLLKVADNHDRSFEKIRDLLEEFKTTKGTLECHCVYMLVGDMDVLIQLWTDEKSASEFKKILDDLKPGIQLWRQHLAYTAKTWFGKIIENRHPNWGEALNTDQLQTALMRDPDSKDFEALRLHASLPCDRDASRCENSKFWVFFQHEKYVKSNTLEEFRGKLEDIANNLEEHEISYVSIYAIYEPNRNHLIVLKGESVDPVKSIFQLNQEVHKAHNEHQYQIANAHRFHAQSYIAAGAINQPNHKWIPLDSRNELFPDERMDLEFAKKRAIRNLVISHHTFDKRAVTESAERAFINVLYKQYDSLFMYACDPLWDHTVLRLRRLYRWLIQDDEKKSKAFIVEDYIQIESDMNECFLDYFLETYSTSKVNKEAHDLCSKIINKARVPLKTLNKENFAALRDVFITSYLEKHSSIPTPDQFTLGKVANEIITSLIKDGDDLVEDEKRSLVRISDAVKEISKDRNDLGHANIKRITDMHNGAYQWVRFLENYAIYFSVAYIELDQFRERVFCKPSKISTNPIND